MCGARGPNKSHGLIRESQLEGEPTDEKHDESLHLGAIGDCSGVLWLFKET